MHLGLHQPRFSSGDYPPKTERRRSVLARHPDRRRYVSGLDRQCRTARGPKPACSYYRRTPRALERHRHGSGWPIRDALDTGTVWGSHGNVNRIVKQLRDDNILEFHRGSVSVIDEQKLLELADFDGLYLHQRPSL